MEQTVPLADKTRKRMYISWKKMMPDQFKFQAFKHLIRWMAVVAHKCLSFLPIFTTTYIDNFFNRNNFHFVKP